MWAFGKPVIFVFTIIKIAKTTQKYTTTITLLFTKYDPFTRLLEHYQLFIHLRRESFRRVSPSNRSGCCSNCSLASSRDSSTLISFVTKHSPLSFRNVWFTSFPVGSPNGNRIGTIFTRCLTFHNIALVSGMFFTTATAGPWKSNRA